MQKIRLPGSLGQIGTELTRELRWRFGIFARKLPSTLR